MNILIVSQYFWPESFPINDIALGLKAEGHNISVLTGMPNYPHGKYFPGYSLLKKSYECYQGIGIHRVPLITRGNGNGIRLILNYLSFALSASILAPFRCRETYDVILVYMPSPVTVGLPALVLTKLKHAPILFWAQDLWPEALSSTGAIKSPRILKWVEHLTRYIYKGCDRILVQSRAFIPAIERLGIAKEKIFYLPNPVADTYKPVVEISQQIEEECELPVGFRIIYADNVGVSQSFETILAAASLLKRYSMIHWIIIGTGRQKTWLIQQVAARDLGSQVHLIDQKPVERMPHYFHLANALLVSLKRGPAFSLTIPSKLQSYLACGKPVIASLDGEAARIIEEANAGLTSAAEDAESLAENVLALYKASKEVRDNMGRKGREYFERNFESAHLLKQLESWMLELA